VLTTEGAAAGPCQYKPPSAEKAHWEVQRPCPCPQEHRPTSQTKLKTLSLRTGLPGGCPRLWLEAS
jgi:hypothetical protein